MAGLYAACDCLVPPYRSEGFGLPVAEAMGCGLPVIVTGFGAALDYCSLERAYLVPARSVRLPERRVGELETVDWPFWAEPDQDILRYLLRRVVERPQEARAKGRHAAEYVRTRLTWGHAADAVERRLRVLAERPSAAVLPSPSAALHVPVDRADRPRVSLTMIVKDEEHTLSTCLDSVADLVGEVVIVDTGSADATVAVAERYGVKVFHFPWVDSFAAARNEVLKHATGDWAFWIDADDRLDEENREKLRELLRGLPEANVGFVMKCLCVKDDSGTAIVVDHVRLFRTHPEVR